VTTPELNEAAGEMEDLDLIADRGKNELVPRDPTTITSEIE
jgi:hypothetical protein